MADQPEFGVRVLETGYMCPDSFRLNFLPFAPTQDINLFLNVSGYQGPIPYPSTGSLGTGNTFSGILGNGTPYPGSGTLEQLSRLFWCVKSWSMEVQVNLTLPTKFGTYNDPFTDEEELDVSFCSSTAIGTTTLQIRDIYASGLANPAYTPDDPNNKEIVTANAVPLDPIIRFEDLFCRGKYFSWIPPEFVRTGLFSMTPAQVDQNASNQFQDASPLMLRFGNMTITDNNPEGFHFPPAMYGLASLSIMNTDGICFPQSSMLPTGYLPCSTPNGTEPNEISGTHFLLPQTSTGTLVNETGMITGYGYYPMVSGSPPILGYRPNCPAQVQISPELDLSVSGCKPEDFYPEYNQQYFPYINFFMQMRNGATDTADQLLCTFEALVSTIRPNTGIWSSCGTFSIYDPAISGYAFQEITVTGTGSNGLPQNPYQTGVGGLASSAMFTCPLYTNIAKPSNLNVSVTLQANDFWIKLPSGLVNY